MLKKVNNIVFIHAKGTSERVHAKNLRKINGVSLVRLAALKAIEAGCFSVVYIDTESDNIWDEVKDLDVKLIKRDPKLATNSTNGNTLLEYSTKNSIKSDNYFILSCTTPLVSAETIFKCVSFFNEKNTEYDSVVAVNEMREYYWRDNKPSYDLVDIPNSFNLSPLLVETHAIYGITSKAFVKLNRRIGDKVLLYSMPKIESMDIDTEEDFRICEILSKG